MSTAKVDIVIVNWNSGQLIQELMESLEKIPDRNSVGSIVILDNASTDQSFIELQKQRWALRVKFVQNADNKGFAKACNMGAKLGSSKYILFLNPDTLVYSHAILKSLEFLEKDEAEAYGACGIQLVDHYNVPNRSCARIPTFRHFVNSAFGLNSLWPKYFHGILIREWSHNQTQDVGHVIGAFYFVRRSLFEKLNGFDERFFLYYEDLDFSTTLNLNGYKVAFLSDARAVHIGGGCSQQIKARRLSYSYLSKILYIRKHFGLMKSALLILMVLTIEPITRFLFYLIQFSPKESLVSLQGYAQFLISTVASLFKGNSHANP